MESILNSDSVAVITGAASGIGLAIARLLSTKYSVRVMLADINAEALTHAAETLKMTLTSSSGSGSSEGASVEVCKCDVSNPSDYETLKKKALDTYGRIDMVFLNAGTGTRGGWDASVDEMERVFKTNALGAMYGISAFLPVLQANKSSSHSVICLTGSKQGITNPPGTNPAYNASKSAVKTMAEHLSYTCRDSGVKVHLLVPGWTFTGMTSTQGQEKPTGAWEPDQVAEYMLEKMKKGSFYIICPDNETTEEIDKKRIEWNMQDVMQDRQPLSRWRGGEVGKQFEEFMKK